MDIFLGASSDLSYLELLQLQVDKVHDLVNSLSDQNESFVVEYSEDDSQIYFEHVRQSFAELDSEYVTMQVRLKDGDVILIHLDPTQESVWDLAGDLWQRGPWLIDSIAYYYKSSLRMVHKAYVDI